MSNINNIQNVYSAIKDEELFSQFTTDINLLNALIKYSRMYNLIPLLYRPDEVNALSMIEYLDPEHQEVILFNLDLLNTIKDFGDFLMKLYVAEMDSNPELLKAKNSWERLEIESSFWNELKESLRNDPLLSELKIKNDTKVYNA